jgi:hypothetical protein
VCRVHHSNPSVVIAKSSEDEKVCTNTQCMCVEGKGRSQMDKARGKGGGNLTGRCLSMAVYVKGEAQPK